MQLVMGSKDREYANDSDEFSELFDANFDDIWSFIRRRLSSPEDADDVTSMVFATAWKRWHELPPRSEQRLWLFGVAKKVLQSTRRSDTRRLRLVDRLNGLRGANIHMDHTDRDDSLWVALSRLRERDRDLLIMRSWDQLTIPEIATLLGCSTNAVSVRLYKAKAQLKKKLSETENKVSGNEVFELDVKGT